jgi:hypothetical protein
MTPEEMALARQEALYQGEGPNYEGAEEFVAAAGRWLAENLCTCGCELDGEVCLACLP